MSATGSTPNRSGMRCGHELEHEAGAVLGPARLDRIEVGQPLVRAIQHRHQPAIDAMGVLHDPAGRRLAEDLGQPRDRQAVRGDQVGQHLPRADRRQLVDVADQKQRRFRRQGGEHRLHQRQIDHRHLVDDQEIAGQRALGAPPKAAPRLGFEQAVQGPGVPPGALAEASRGAAGRRRQLDVDPGLGQTEQDRLDQRGLAGAGAAGDHQELARQRRGERGALPRRETQRQLALDPAEARFGVLDRPGRAAARQRAQPLRDLALRLMDRGQEHARRAVDARPRSGRRPRSPP